MSSTNFIIQESGGVVLAQLLKDRITEPAVIQEIGNALVERCDREMKISLVIDLSRVTHMSSAMIGKLVAVHKSVKKSKGRLAVCSVSKTILPIFQVTKMDKVLDLQPDTSQAILKFQRKPIK